MTPPVVWSRRGRARGPDAFVPFLVSGTERPEVIGCGWACRSPRSPRAVAVEREAEFDVPWRETSRAVVRVRNIDLARRSRRNLVGPGRAPGRGERAAGSSTPAVPVLRPVVEHHDRVALARLRQVHPQISGVDEELLHAGNLRNRVSAPHVRVMPPRAARSECLAGRCSGAADRRRAPARAAAPSC